jgi:antiviral helicase SKI2
MNTVTEELIATELILENLLTDLCPEEIVALFSALVFQERRNDQPEPQLCTRLERARVDLVHLTGRLATVQAEVGLNVSPTEYTREKLNFVLMEVVYEWARGMPFADICQLTDILEGSIVRCIVRLDETCR